MYTSAEDWKTEILLYTTKYNIKQYINTLAIIKTEQFHCLL